MRKTKAEMAELLSKPPPKKVDRFKDYEPKPGEIPEEWRSNETKSRTTNGSTQERTH